MAMAHRLGGSADRPTSIDDARGATPTRFRHPGFLDLQVNGFAGVDYNEPETTSDRILESVGALRRSGVTRFLATLISQPLDRFSQCA
jgi:N-acetylglucosamine-6-phosphate deacetylase